MTVGVEPFHWPVYSDSLLMDLRRTRLFADVRPLADCPGRPDLIARVDSPDNGGTATIPIWTALTLGVVPTVVPESANEDFSLRLPPDGRPCHVLSEVPTTTTLGWAALLVGLSPDGTLGSVQNSDRYAGRLALSILNGWREAAATTRPMASWPAATDR